MLQMVRTGDLNYKQALSNSMSMSAGVPVQSSDVLRQSKTSIIVFTSLVCRAAIEGGLSPEEAYSLGDSYIQAAESAKSLDELSPLAMMMYDDFIRRVHKHRTNPNLSMQIQKCVDYIEMNLDKKIVAEDLAALVGYTEYYLTHKFKEETGLSVTNYVKFAKVERAKVLLEGLAVFQQHIVHRPCINGKALDTRVPRKGLPDALLHIGKQAVDVPFQMTVHPTDAIRKTVHFLGAENAILHPTMCRPLDAPMSMARWFFA